MLRSALAPHLQPLSYEFICPCQIPRAAEVLRRCRHAAPAIHGAHDQPHDRAKERLTLDRGTRGSSLIAEKATV